MYVSPCYWIASGDIWKNKYVNFIFYIDIGKRRPYNESQR